MKSYLVLTPPGGSDPDHRKTIVMADRFSWLALLFPGIWLLTKRLWLPAIAVFLIQAIAGQLTQVSGLELVGVLGALSISLLVALEGRHFYSEVLIRRGWTLQDVITATDLEAAEEFYFAGQQQARTELPAVAGWARPSTAPPSTGWNQGGIGLFDHQGGR